MSTSWKECLASWKEFYSSLYKGTYKSEDSNSKAKPEKRKAKVLIQTLNQEQKTELEKDIEMAEIVDAIFSLKNFTTAGSDSMLSRDLTILMDTSDESEFSKNREILEFIHKMMMNMWRTEKIPKKLKESVLRPFLKGDGNDPKNPSNYRPVSLLNTLRKVYEEVIKKRLMVQLEHSGFFAEAQAAYRNGRSTADHLLVLQEVFYHYRYTKLGPRGGKGKKPLYYIFMDLIKAFDTIPRLILF